MVSATSRAKSNVIRAEASMPAAWIIGLAYGLPASRSTMLIGAVGGASPCTSLRNTRRAATLERDAAAEARKGAVPVGTGLTCLATGRSVGRGTGGWVGCGPAAEAARPGAVERPVPVSGAGTFFGLMIGSI